MAKTALVLRHVCFEDIGAFAAPLRDSGYAIRYCEIGVDDPPAFDEPDLLAILGGPIGAYQEDLYPYLTDEIALIAARLAAGKPTLGICLGAQLMARALGARVYPGRAKEIGWIPLSLTEAGAKVLAPFEGHPVLHWHGDTFELPQGAVNLASTPDCDQQAFVYGGHALAFQFHPEAAPAGFERWLIGHSCEIAATENVSAPQLRAAMREYGAASARRGQTVLADWLKRLA
jgi:GMP synthase (glutamine-hydrolysing)